MEDLVNAYDSIRRYFNVLEYTGSYDKDETKGLLMYSFIVDQIFNGLLSEYLDDEGLNSINKALDCLYRRGCLINRPPYDHIRLSKPHGYGLSNMPRITEDIDYRITHTDELRIKE